MYIYKNTFRKSVSQKDKFIDKCISINLWFLIYYISSFKRLVCPEANNEKIGLPEATISFRK